MKRLSNISPFILLLVPVFVMMLLTFSSTAEAGMQNETALKTTSNSWIKSVTALIK